MTAAQPRLHFTETFDLPREEAFRLLRDHLPKVAPFIPEIEEVTVLERQDDGPRTTLKNKWQADYPIPRVARPFVRKSMLNWVDENVWDETDWTCRWTFIPSYFAKAVRCSGVNRYEELPNGRCRLVSDGELELDLAQVRGIPRLLARRANKSIEKILIKLVTPNLSRIADGLRRYLADRDG